MIYTVTLNPALDYVIQVPQFRVGQINRMTSEHIYYGGKGINVSIILNELGVETCALGFVADFTGRELETGLNRLGIRTDFVHVKEGMTRINVKMKSEEETEINGQGPKVTKKDFLDLLEKVRAIPAGDTIVVSGNIPSFMPSDSYERLLEQVQPGVRIVVDAEKDLLISTLRFHPFVIKPNIDELSVMFDTKIQTLQEIVHYAKALQSKGAENVLVSMAGQGSMLVDEQGQTVIQPAAEGTVVNSVGAGDSMVAGFIAGYLRKKDYAYAQKLGASAGAATAFHSGLATKEQIDEVFKTL